MEHYAFDETRKEQIPFWGNKQQLNEFIELTQRCLKTLETTPSAREMVLETWLTVDFALRQFLISGFELYRFCDEGFDLRYTLLPNSFENLIRLFEETKKICSKYPVESAPTHKDKEGGFRSSYEFLKYVRDEHPDLWEKMSQVTKEYRIKMNPGLSEHIKDSNVFFVIPAENEITRINSGWIKVAEKLDDDWFKKASRLNKARNTAAHQPDIDKIGKNFGFTGNNTTELIRAECQKLLEAILNVSAINFEGIA